MCIKLELNSCGEKNVRRGGHQCGSPAGRIISLVGPLFQITGRGCKYISNKHILSVPT